MGKAQKQSSSTSALLCTQQTLSPLCFTLCKGLRMLLLCRATETDRKMAELTFVRVPCHQCSKIRIRHSRSQNVTDGEKKDCALSFL